MKRKLILNIVVIVILAIVALSFFYGLVDEASGVRNYLYRQTITYSVARNAEYYRLKVDGNIRMLRTLANIMANYEALPPEMRRDHYDDILYSTLAAEPDLTAIYTVWKPNALDGMDAQFIGRVGSTYTGQYAIAYTRETGGIRPQITSDVDGAMTYFYNTDARKDRVEYLPRISAGKEFNEILMMVPIINPYTNEVVGGVGCLIEANNLFPTYDFINIFMPFRYAAIAIYSDNGFIINQYIASEKYTDIDAIYGDRLYDVINFVRGDYYAAGFYSTTNQIDIELYPIRTGNLDTTWTIMIAVNERDMLNENTRLIIIFGIISLLATAAIVFFVLRTVQMMSRKAAPVPASSGVLPQANSAEQTPPAPPPEKITFKSILQRIAAERGFSIFEDLAKCKSLLQDYTAGEFKKESRLLMLAIEAGCPVEMARSTEQEITQKKLINKLHDEFAMEKAAAEQIVTLLYDVYNKGTN